MIRPLSEYVLIDKTPVDSTTKSGIILTGSAVQDANEGVVAAVGPGKLYLNGAFHPIQVTPGQTVLYAKYAGIDIKLNGKQYLLVRESDLLAVVQ